MVILAMGFNDQVDVDQISYQRVRSITRKNGESEKKYKCWEEHGYTL